MRNLLIVVALLLIALPTLAAEAVDQVRQAEATFARAFTDRDSTTFFSFVAEDATFLGAHRTLNGRDAVIEGWSNLLKGAAPFSWSPERVVINGTGDLGMTSGPVLDPSGRHIADFLSVWQKQKDGSWKILFDGPGAPVCAPEKK